LILFAKGVIIMRVNSPNGPPGLHTTCVSTISGGTNEGLKSIHLKIFDIFDVLELPDENREDQIIMSETHSHLRKLVDMLPAEQREVVILRHYADMSFKEISALTRVSINTALGRMRYALINIRKMMEEKSIVLQ
jgi:RNA polymerase sigma factor (sigma-70 family)